jgi:hypothetical protein
MIGVWLIHRLLAGFKASSRTHWLEIGANHRARLPLHWITRITILDNKDHNIDGQRT